MRHTSRGSYHARDRDDDSPGLPTTSQELWRQLEAAQTQADKHLEGLDALRREYHTNSYLEDGGVQGEGQDGDDALWNHPHAWCSLIVPILAGNDPRARLKDPGMTMPKSHMLGAQAALNQWSQDVTYSDMLRDGAVLNMQFAWGAQVVTMDADPDANAVEYSHLGADMKPRENGSEPYRGVPQKVFVHDLDPRMVLLDPFATNIRACQWRAWRWVRLREGMIERAEANPDEGWDLELLRSGTSDDSDERLDRPIDLGIERDELTGWDVWIPGWQPDPEKGPEQGYHGAIVTVLHAPGASSSNNSSDWLRKPRPFFGPPHGPLHLFRAYKIPQRIWPAAPLVLARGLASELNSQLGVMNDSARSYKRIAVAMGDAELATAINDADHDELVVGTDETKENVAIASVEVGGLTAQMEVNRARIFEMLEGISGLTAAKQGLVKGEATATELRIADGGANVKLSDLKKGVLRGMRDVFRAVLWYFLNDARIIQAIDPDEAERAGLDPGATWFGGQTGSVPDDAMRVDIDPYSTPETDQAQAMEQSAAMFQAASFLAEVRGPQAVNTEVLLDAMARAYDRPEFRDLELRPEDQGPSTQPQLVSNRQAASRMGPRPQAPAAPGGLGGGFRGQNKPASEQRAEALSKAPAPMVSEVTA